MCAFVLRVNPKEPESEAIHKAAAVIKKGGLVAFPTETVYGLGADAFDARAVEKIFVAKERPRWDPTIVHVSSIAMAKQVVKEHPPLFNQMAQRFWAGPLTLVVPKAETIPDIVTASLPTVAVRMPAHPVALALIEASGAPIAAPSANKFGRPSPTRAEHVLEDLAECIDLVLDAGATALGIESTVLDLTQNPPSVLRLGWVTVEELTEAIGTVRILHLASSPEVAQLDASKKLGFPSPGMSPRHYAPKAELRVFDGELQNIWEQMLACAAEAVRNGKSVGVLTPDEMAGHLQGLRVAVFSLGSFERLEDVARNLFAGLRALDAAGVNVILCPLPPERGLGRAVRDRLLKAAS